MITEKIKLIVLDLDGTLYDINDVIKSVYQQQVLFLSSKLNKTHHEIDAFLANHGVYPYVTNESKSATELFAQLGINMEEWKTYRNTHFDVSLIQKDKAVNESVIYSLTQINKIVLLSSNTMSSIEKVLSHLLISKDLFCEVICSDSLPSNQRFEKKAAMKYLSDKYNIPFGMMLSIGDRYQTDIKPMLELGGTGVLLKSPQSMKKVIMDMKESRLESCKEYELYKL